MFKTEDCGIIYFEQSYAFVQGTTWQQVYKNSDKEGLGYAFDQNQITAMPDRTERSELLFSERGFFVAVLLSLFVYYYNGLWIAAAFHTAWNFTQSIIFGLPNSGIVSAYSN